MSSARRYCVSASVSSPRSRAMSARFREAAGFAGVVSEAVGDFQGAAVLGFGFGEIAVVAREDAEVLVTPRMPA